MFSLIFPFHELTKLIYACGEVLFVSSSNPLNQISHTLCSLYEAGT